MESKILLLFALRTMTVSHILFIILFDVAFFFIYTHYNIQFCTAMSVSLCTSLQSNL